MRRPVKLAAGLLALAVCLSAALAAGGSAGDPLVSLSYLTDTFLHTVDSVVDSRLDSADQALREGSGIPQDGLGSQTGSAGQSILAAPSETTLKAGDILAVSTGFTLVPLGGEIQVTVDAGAVVDATVGEEVSSGEILSPLHRYIVAEDAAAFFTVDSPTAVLSYQGEHIYSPANHTPDYYAISCALRDLGLFRGTGSGIGEGFDLHLAPNRGEGLVMFIRILGEEAQALSCTYSHPFTDVPVWLDRYVAWAYEKGYSNGVAPDTFGAGQTISAPEYEEFLLRAMGYSQAGVDDYTTSLHRAQGWGILTEGERELLESGSFRRAHVAYLSYYSLDVPLSGSRQTLAQRLEEAGLFSRQQLALARSLVTSQRIS